MREDGDLGEVLVVQGTYSQDWLLYETDWNWRIDAKAGGALRAMGDIGSHWFDMAEHLTGLRVRSLCADLQTFYPTRKRPKQSIETFGGKLLTAADVEDTPVQTEDFGAVLFRMGDHARGAMTASQVSAGQEEPSQHRNLRDKVISPLGPGAARRVVDRAAQQPEPGDRQRSVAAEEGGCCDTPICPAATPRDTTTRSSRSFAGSIHRSPSPNSPAEYPQMTDGLRQMRIMEAELASHRNRHWVDVPND